MTMSRTSRSSDGRSGRARAGLQPGAGVPGRDELVRDRGL